MYHVIREIMPHNDNFQVEEQRYKNVFLPAFLVLATLTGYFSPLAQASEKFGYHEVRLDDQGGIVPWYGSGPSEAYDHVIRLVWNFWINMPACENGVPYYMQHQVWKQGQHDPRGLGGDQINMALSSWNLLYGYLGDETIKHNMIFMADYWLGHGISPPDLPWGNLPYPYNMDLHSGNYDGDMRAGKGYLQPDKAASFGAELIILYKMTANARYLDAATAIANTLATRIQPGDVDHSPWPFRVDAATGKVHAQVADGKTHDAAYTANWSPALRLFEELTVLNHGKIIDYKRAFQIVSDWVKTYPLKNNKWGPFFEDIDTAHYSDTEINADTMANYILEHPQWDPAWRKDAQGVLNWTYLKFANHEFEKWGVVPINEQTQYLVPGNSHTARHASVELIYCEKSGDCANKGAAIRRLNWATYTVDFDGKNRYPQDDIWLTDGYGDYIRHYLRAMAAAPELAPKDQNHLLRTSSVLQSIHYFPGRIEYTKFDNQSVETLKLGASTPKSVKGGSMDWNPATKVLIVKASRKDVVVYCTPTSR
jgi:hypothetical protein